MTTPADLIATKVNLSLENVMRDAFALGAMVGFLSQRDVDDEDRAGGRSFDFVAKISYRMASAMMDERRRVIGGDDGKA